VLIEADGPLGARLFRRLILLSCRIGFADALTDDATLLDLLVEF
jgi:hypothetical protein